MVKKNKKNIDYFLITLSSVQTIIFFSPKYIFIQPIILIGFAFYSIFNKSNSNIIYIISFLAGCDTYYRQVQISGDSTILPWEISKYLSCLICYMFYFLSKGRIRRKYSVLFDIFIILCIPAVIIAISKTTLTYDSVKEALSGYFSGLLSLFIVCKTFDGLEIEVKELKKIIVYYFIGIMPTIGILISNLFTVSTIDFSTNSNFEFSGYGPIHISTALSFLICLLFITNYYYNLFKYKYLIYFTTLFFLLLMILTFSRSGLIMFIISMFSSFIVLENKKSFLLPIISFGLIFYLFINPLLNSITYGAFEERYSEVTPSSRIELIKSDFSIWSENPIFGVGLGYAKFSRDDYGSAINLSKSHTEYSRFLSEQGIFGLLCMVILFFVFFDRLKAEKSPKFLPLTVFFIVFPSLYFIVNAFSTFLPAYGLAISLIKIKNKNF